jgi:hypothetical protein
MVGKVNNGDGESKCGGRRVGETGRTIGEGARATEARDGMGDEVDWLATEHAVQEG